MCKPAREGGQRCAAHTREQYEAALERHDLQQTSFSYEALRDAAAEHASTPRGRKEIEAAGQALAHDEATAAFYDDALRRGEDISERRRAADAAVVAAAGRAPGRQDADVDAAVAVLNASARDDGRDGSAFRTAELMIRAGFTDGGDFFRRNGVQRLGWEIAQVHGAGATRREIAEAVVTSGWHRRG